jgi:glycosyltransferase involved in cell wall biosynthesis
MKIVFLLPSAGTTPGGGLKVAYEYANGLAKRKHEVHLVHAATSFPIGIQKTPRQMLEYLRYFSFAVRGNWKPVRWFTLHPAVKLSWIPWISRAFLPQADAYVATWWVTAQHFNAINDLSGRRFYLIQHLETWGGHEEMVMATWKMPFQKIVISLWLQKLGTELGETCQYIPNGLDFTKFDCHVPPQERFPKRIAMLFVTGVTWKGSADGLAALELLKMRYPDLEAEFFGVHPRPDALPPWVIYHQDPPQDELHRIYNRAAIFLAPSHSEGWGLPAAEAMMCGAAVVATDIGGHQEYCISGQNSLLVSPRRPEEMSEAMSQLVEDQALRVRLAESGYDSIRRFTWDKAVNALEGLLMRENK